MTRLLSIFDGHNDVLARLRKSGRPDTFFKRNHQGHVDLPRMRAGGMVGGFFAVYVNDLRPRRPSSPFPALDPEVARREMLAMTGILFHLEATSRGRLRVVRTMADLRHCLTHGIIAAILHFEGAEAIDPDLDALDAWHRLGLRSLGITWSRPTAFGYGVPFKFPGTPNQGPGLTAVGKRLVAACNRLGILIDLSHLNERGFWDVAKRSTHPLVATHSGAHVLCRSPRNLTDRQLDAIRDSGGVVGVNYYTGFLREDGKGDPRTPLEEIVRHVEYIGLRIGLDHVALGSDFDGATVPRPLRDVAGLPRLIQAFRRRGYSEADLKKLVLGNWLRVLGATWRSR